MKLIELEPMWYRYIDDRSFREVDSLQEAHGIRFLCPVCWHTNAGPIGTHSILCWRPSVPLTCYPAPGRWEFEGTGFENLTLVARSSSILLTSGCNAHFFIRNGEICQC